jgi:hypothetical protein
MGAGLRDRGLDPSYNGGVIDNIDHSRDYSQDTTAPNSIITWKLKGLSDLSTEWTV